jgi:putative peptidoglycan lipid II flippase
VVSDRPPVATRARSSAFTAEDTTAVAAALTAISAGLPGHVLEKIFGAVSFAHEDTHTPMVAALCGLVTAIVGDLLLFPGYQHTGVAAAIAVSGWVGATVLGSVLYRRRWLRLDDYARRRLSRIVAATAAMGVAVGCGLVVGNHLFAGAGTSPLGRLAILFVLVTLGIAIYAAALHVLAWCREAQGNRRRTTCAHVKALRRAPSAWHGSARN